MIRWCARCVMPSTRPDLHFDTQGVCGACKSTAAKRDIDWAARACEWAELCQWAKETARDREYDCVAAVSGGKDSTFIVRTLLDHGLRTLGVSFEPTMMTPTGQANLENLQHLGIDVIQVKKNREVYRRWGRIGFQLLGDHENSNHRGIYSSPVREAVLRNIPLVVWGESPTREYGSPEDKVNWQELNAAWVAEFGCELGLRLSDLIARHGFTHAELAPYRFPDLKETGIRSVFLGNFFPWDTVKQAEYVIAKCGFRPLVKPPHGALWNFENVDCKLEHWHDWLGYLKFGYNRIHAQASIAIRHGHMARVDAVRAIRSSTAHLFPAHSLGHLAAYLGMNTDEIIATCDAFTNRDIFEFEGDKPVKVGNPFWAGNQYGSPVHRFPLA